MTSRSIPKIVVDEKVELAVSLVGIVAVCVATYHAGNTGHWEPLSATSFGLGLIVLFVTSER